MTKPLTIYGIKACDTMKKARDWLDAAGLAYAFHDYKVAGIDPDVLQGWVARVGVDTLVNRAGTTFRKLSDAEKADLTPERAIDLMRTHPTLIKRPVLVGDGVFLVGFKPDAYAAAFR
ncbi:MAG: arsenate reductase [Rhizobiales bacterium 32-66-8]|nr:MAG: arsenate reductase [Rhizobiales bacterium 32-66-8]